MLGSAEEWFYRGLAGINVDLAHKGASRLVLHPNVVGNIAWARGRYLSALGPVTSEWHRGTTATIYNFSVPANATAIIEIDAQAAQSATVNGTPASQAAGVLEARIEGPRLVITVGSGKYQVRAASPVR